MRFIFSFILFFEAMVLYFNVTKSIENTVGWTDDQKRLNFIVTDIIFIINFILILYLGVSK